MTCLEALAHGVPLIAMDCGGPAELFEHGESGYLIPNRDVEAGAKTILLLSNDSEMRTRFSKNSVRYVRRKFSNENTFKKLADVYAKTLPCKGFLKDKSCLNSYS
jgi:glycosyltransferase involved in cell wall biosynthesis